MIDPINSSMSLQAPTESTPIPPPKPALFTVEDSVTLSSATDKDHDGESD